MPCTAKSKAASRTNRIKRRHDNDEVSDDNNKENTDEKQMTSKKKIQEQQNLSNKKQVKQRSPSPIPIESKEKASNISNMKSSRSRANAEASSTEPLKDSSTSKEANKKKKNVDPPSNDSKSKRRQSPSPATIPSSSIELINTSKKRTTKAVLPISTTPVTAKNIRHRSISSSDITADKNKKSVKATKATTSKSKTHLSTNVQASRSKSSMARGTNLMNTTRRTMRRQTTYLTISSNINSNIKGGQVLAVGENGMTQLGLKSSIDQRKNPQPVLIPEPILQIAAGPLHSVCLTDQNNIYTFGCNDEHALGRSDNNDDDDATDPFGEVDLSEVMNLDDESIIQIVAGDSHTLALSNLGKVYGWGTFRSSSNGIYGLVDMRQMAPRPIEITLPEKIVKIASGNDFVLFLSETGQVYSCGNGETGQLGRLNRYASEDGRRGGIDRLITPAPILYNRSSVKEKNLLFEDIFTGAHHYFLKVQGKSYILGGGLNNFHQIGLSSTESVFFPIHIPSLDGYEWKKFAGGLHHTIGLTIDGKVYAIGRCHEGQLGIDGLTNHLDKPTLIPNVPKAVDIACGNHVSFIIDENGKVYSFGTGTSLQHGHGEDDVKIPRMMSSKFMDMKKIVNIAVGAQHTIFLTKE